jgi:hypothetical protein
MGNMGCAAHRWGRLSAGESEGGFLVGHLLKRQRHGARVAARPARLSKTGGDPPSGGGSGLVGKEGGRARFSQLGQIGEEMNFKF